MEREIEDSTIASQSRFEPIQDAELFQAADRAELHPNSTERLGIRIEHEVGQLDFARLRLQSLRWTPAASVPGTRNIVPQQAWVFEVVNEFISGPKETWCSPYRHFLITDAIDRVPIYSSSNPSSVFRRSRQHWIRNRRRSNREPYSSAGPPQNRARPAQADCNSAMVQRHRSDYGGNANRSAASILSNTPSSFRQDLSRWRADWGASFLRPALHSSTVKGCTESQYRFDEIDNYRATPTISLFAEYQPWKGTSLRIEADNVLQQRYNRVVNIYAGPRNAFPLSYSRRPQPYLIRFCSRQPAKNILSRSSPQINSRILAPTIWWLHGIIGPEKRPEGLGMPLGAFRGGNPLERIVAISDKTTTNLLPACQPQ